MLHKHLDQFCIAYLNDIVVYSKFLEQHREHARLVLANFKKQAYT
jgi:hypothetical protein